jgi:D-arabinose 1-dehydrogenase-like Zn-dependent alcohol dehydrogenase
MGAEVTAISTSDSKRNEVAQLGAKHFINSKEPDAFKQYQQAFDFILVAASGNINFSILHTLGLTILNLRISRLGIPC